MALTLGYVQNFIGYIFDNFVQLQIPIGCVICDSAHIRYEFLVICACINFFQGMHH